MTTVMIAPLPTTHALVKARYLAIRSCGVHESRIEIIIGNKLLIYLLIYSSFATGVTGGHILFQCSKSTRVEYRAFLRRCGKTQLSYSFYFYLTFP